MSSPIAAVRAELAALREHVAALERRLAAVEATRPRPRDVEDLLLRKQIAVSTRGLAFRSVDLFRHAAVDPALAATLRGATIEQNSTRELGAWLRGQTGAREGIVVQRLRGRRWRVDMCDM